jgi:hypothetical protein
MLVSFGLVRLTRLLVRSGFVSRLADLTGQIQRIGKNPQVSAESLSIAVDSTVGQGTTFTFRIPVRGE